MADSPHISPDNTSPSDSEPDSPNSSADLDLSRSQGSHDDAPDQMGTEATDQHAPLPSASKPKRSLAKIAGIVAAATLLSKVFGLLRQVAIAAAFGVGPAYGAYNFAYVIPGFLLILLGGINGPFHSAIVSVLSKRPPKESAAVIETITTLVVGILLVVTVLLVIFAQPMLYLTAPGLFTSLPEVLANGGTAESFAVLQQTKQIAITQFQIMAPLAMLAGLIGIGFGTLNATDQYWLPSVSPLFSSVTVLVGVGGLMLWFGNKIVAPENALLGGEVLAWATLAGAVLQWLIQLPAQWRSGMGGLRLRFNFRQPAVREIIKIMGPATFSSGMLQINVWTDLFFASFIPNASAAVSAMGYAGLLIQTPLGILSNVILVPLLPMLSKLTDPSDRPEFRQRIRQGMVLTALTMWPIGGIMTAAAVPITQVVYERYAFTAEDSQLTAAVLMAYAVGMFVYLGRDVLVRVFYALEDGDTPFRISIVNIFLNGVLDFILVKPFGAPGIILATVTVNLLSMVAMIYFLDRRLNGLGWQSWLMPIGGLSVLGLIAGLVCRFSYDWLIHLTGSGSFLIKLLWLGVTSGLGLLVFAVGALLLRIPEVNEFKEMMLQRFKR